MNFTIQSRSFPLCLYFLYFNLIKYNPPHKGLTEGIKFLKKDHLVDYAWDLVTPLSSAIGQLLIVYIRHWSCFSRIKPRIKL